MLPDRVSNPGPLTYESGALLHNIMANNVDPDQAAVRSQSDQGLHCFILCQNSGIITVKYLFHC